MIAIRLPGAFTDPTLPILQRDEVIVSGTLWCADMARSYSWAGGAPANNSQIKDLTIADRHSTYVHTGGGTPALAGGGIDFTNADPGPSYLKIPESVAAALWGGSQYFLACAYLKLPSAADWSDAGSNPSNYDKIMWQFATTLNYAGESVLLALSQKSNGDLAFTRPTAIAAPVILTLASAGLASLKGTVCQIGMWRNASGTGFRVKNASTSALATGVVGSANSASFAAKYGQIGIIENSACRPSGSEENFRFYRGFVEDLALSARNPTTVLDDDWARTAARAVFS